MCEIIKNVPRIVRHGSCCYDIGHIPSENFPCTPTTYVRNLHIRHFQFRQQSECLIAMLVSWNSVVKEALLCTPVCTQCSHIQDMHLQSFCEWKETYIGLMYINQQDAQISVIKLYFPIRFSTCPYYNHSIARLIGIYQIRCTTYEKLFLMMD